MPRSEQDAIARAKEELGKKLPALEGLTFQATEIESD
jgi:hypothetical protein